VLECQVIFFSLTRHVIRDINTRAYFLAGSWVDDLALAQDFKHTRLVIEACATYNLRDVEMVIQVSENAKYDIIFPISGVWARSQPHAEESP
jgi:hypothetical protein